MSLLGQSRASVGVAEADELVEVVLPRPFELVLELELAAVELDEELTLVEAELAVDELPVADVDVDGLAVAEVDVEVLAVAEVDVEELPVAEVDVDELPDNDELIDVDKLLGEETVAVDELAEEELLLVVVVTEGGAFATLMAPTKLFPLEATV